MARQIPTCATHSCSTFVVAPVTANRKVRRLPRMVPSSTDARLEGCLIFDYVNDTLFAPAAAAASHKPSRLPHTHTAYCTVQLRISLLHTVRRCYATRRIKWQGLSLRRVSQSSTSTSSFYRHVKRIRELSRLHARIRW